MKETLVEILRSIEEDEELDSEERNTEYRSVLDEWKQDRPRLAEAIDGDLSFYESMSELAKKHSIWRLILPRLKDKEHDKKVEEFDIGELFSETELLNYRSAFKTGPPSVDNPSFKKRLELLGFEAATKMANPVMMGIGGGVFINLLTTINSLTLSFDPALFVTGAVCGAIGGMIPIYFRRETIKDALKDASYLDTKIKEVYEL